MLGALIGAFGKVIDHWFTDTEKDKKLIDKITSISEHGEGCECITCTKQKDYE